MAWIVLACVVGLILAVSLAAAVAVTLRTWPWARLVRRRVMVVLLDERVLEGILYERRGPLLVLRDAAVHTSGQRVAADGEVVIERARVAWVQVLGS